MCGIVGIINFDREPIDLGILSKMTDSQLHRGPDDQGRMVFSLERGTYRDIETKQRTGLMPFEGGVGFNRLSILDLSSSGHQPMVSEDKKVIIAFNGEIYNAFDLRPDLEKKGFKFRSNTDTEVILNLYLAYGQEEMLAKLNGMFAICMIDLRQKRITLARDRLGIKPLYISRLGKQILFASEVKSFLFHPRFKVDVDLGSLDEYLTFRYCAQSRHLLSKVEQVEPGHWAQISTSGTMSMNRYWSIPEMGDGHGQSIQQTVDEAQSRIEASVKRQLLSDVKLGCQLSGGIDSSLINILAAKHAGNNMDAFSVIFKDPKMSEEPWIDEASQRAGVVSHRYELDATYFCENIQKASWHLDQPLNHPNSLGLMFLAEHASKHVKVLLSGEGADEVLGGYARYYYAMLRPWVKPFANGLQRVNPHITSRFGKRLGGAEDPVSNFVMATAFLDQEHAKQLRPEFNLESVLSTRRSLFLEGKSHNHIANCLKYDMRTYMVDLLIRQDKMTMAFSIENRVPLLDHEWIEFVRRNLAVSQLVAWHPCQDPRQWVQKGTKVILKTLASRYFGDAFVFRKKAGFAIPLNDFLTKSIFREKIEDEILPGLRTRGLLNSRYIKTLWANTGSLSSPDLESLWVSLSLEIWLQQFEKQNKESQRCHFVA
jgi:asparagine synthase (glutamine-hydrolysing)